MGDVAEAGVVDDVADAAPDQRIGEIAMHALEPLLLDVFREGQPLGLEQTLHLARRQAMRGGGQCATDSS